MPAHEIVRTCQPVGRRDGIDAGGEARAVSPRARGIGDHRPLSLHLLLACQPIVHGAAKALYRLIVGLLYAPDPLHRVNYHADYEDEHNEPKEDEHEVKYLARRHHTR